MWKGGASLCWRPKKALNVYFLHDFAPLMACLRGVKYWKIHENRRKFENQGGLRPQDAGKIPYSGGDSAVYGEANCRAQSQGTTPIAGQKGSVEGQDTPHSTHTRPLPTRPSSGRLSPLPPARPENGRASWPALPTSQERTKSRTPPRPALCHWPRSALSRPE